MFKCKNGPLLMNMRVPCSIVTYILLKSKIVMMRLSMRFTPCLKMLPNPFNFRNMAICETPTGDDGRTPDGLIRELNIKPLYLDVTCILRLLIVYEDNYMFVLSSG